MKNVVKVTLLSLLMCLFIGSITVFASSKDLIQFKPLDNIVVGEAFTLNIKVDPTIDLKKYKITMSKNIIFDDSYYPFEYVDDPKSELFDWYYFDKTDEYISLHFIALKKGKSKITISTKDDKYVYEFNVTKNNITGVTDKTLLYSKKTKKNIWIGLSKINNKVINYAIKKKSLTKALRKYNVTIYAFGGTFENGSPICGDLVEYGYYGDPDEYYIIENIENGLFNGGLCTYVFGTDEFYMTYYDHGKFIRTDREE